jgi:hypothetical protein
VLAFGGERIGLDRDAQHLGSQRVAAQEAGTAVAGGVGQAHALDGARIVGLELLALHHLHEGLGVGEVAHALGAAHRDGLRVLAAHHRADARAPGVTVQIVHDGGEQHLILARAADRAEAQLRILARLLQRRLGLPGALAPQARASRSSTTSSLIDRYTGFALLPSTMTMAQPAIFSSASQWPPELLQTPGTPAREPRPNPHESTWNSFDLRPRSRLTEALPWLELPATMAWWPPCSTARSAKYVKPLLNGAELP